MGPINDDEDMVTRTVAEAPVRSESHRDAEAVAKRGDDCEGVEELQAPAIEEAGYGYGV